MSDRLQVLSDLAVPHPAWPFLYHGKSLPRQIPILQRSRCAQVSAATNIIFILSLERDAVPDPPLVKVDLVGPWFRYDACSKYAGE